ncbi:flagellar assembly protein FliH [Bacillus solitudinis]|uniref:flagellar assembly protein FliH n=1 Tax=Bacillus solitudinis TaxID=2014074 RepID=UPI0012FE32CA|nr:flagellar assembly protein FliH [Bacillus solitudinis]
MSNIIKSKNAEKSLAETKKIGIRKLFDENAFQDLTFGNETDKPLVDEAPQIEKLIQQELEDAKQQAKQIIAEAQEEAEIIKGQMDEKQNQLEQDIEIAINNSQQQGFNEGFEQGKQSGFEEYSNLITEAKTIVQRAEEDYLQVIEQAEPVILDLASTLCYRIIGKGLELDEELWNSMLHQVMLEVREHENVKIYVHPLWYERTLLQKDELQRMLSHTEKLYIYPDAGLEEQGCLIETKFGRIDATIDSQLRQLKTQLFEKLREE